MIDYLLYKNLCFFSTLSMFSFETCLIQISLLNFALFSVKSFIIITKIGFSRKYFSDGVRGGGEGQVGGKSQSKGEMPLHADLWCRNPVGFSLQT